MRALKIMLLIFVFSGIAISGCGDKGDKGLGDKSTPNRTSAQASSNSGEQHGVGLCDICHDAPSLARTRTGGHKVAFEKDPELHRNLCGKCHEIGSFCGECHPVPEVMKGSVNLDKSR